jgi:HlyD family secretion protein
MKKLFYIATAVIIVVAAYLMLRPKRELVDCFVARQGRFEEILTTDGKVRSRTKETVFAFATGDLETMRVKVGDPVRKGQVVNVLLWDKKFQVKSPIDGVVSKVYRESAGPVNRGEPLLEISSLNDLEIAVEVLTPDAVRLEVGGSARVLNWGGSEELTAKITQVSRAGRVKISALGVEEERTEVRLSLEKTPAELLKRMGDNYHVDVEFLVSAHDNALAVPLGALFKRGEEWALYVHEAGRASPREVKISKRNDRQAMVDSGIREGDEIILFPGDKIHADTKIRCRSN